jgi:hypothetical protein
MTEESVDLFQCNDCHVGVMHLRPLHTSPGLTMNLLLFPTSLHGCVMFAGGVSTTRVPSPGLSPS